MRVASCELRVASCELRVANYTFKAYKLQYIHLRYLASKQKYKTKCLMLNNMGSYGKRGMQGERLIKFNAQQSLTSVLMRDTSAQMSHGSLCQKLMAIKLSKMGVKH